MKKYKNDIKNISISFLNLNLFGKFKVILKILGIRKFIYNTLYFFLTGITKSKNYFLKGIFFDTQKYRSEYIITKNKFNEKFILFTNDNIISKEIYVNEEFDLKKLKKTLKFLNKKKKIENLYDIGANLGVICIPAVKRGLVKKAFAVEAELHNFELLKTNVVLNNLENKISIYNYALSNQDDQEIEMELADDNSGDHRIKNQVKFNIHGEENRKIVKVKTKKFDTLFNKTKQDNDLIWIDTQGYEPVILQGAKKLIESKAPVVIEFWPYALKRANLWEKMFEVLKHFNFYVDLSNQELYLNKINEDSLKKLSEGWEEEKKGMYSLYTDILLLRE
tara:strand:- start:1 stop:1005 length:1005 start_codon:yes stop_codon:yes gene_type:complete